MAASRVADRATPNPERPPPGVAVLVALAWLVPLLLTEAWPLTAAPMFRDDLRRYCTYDLVASRGGAPDTLAALGLHVAYIGNPERSGTGRVLPSPLHRFGEVPEPAWLAERVRERLQPGQQVTVRQRIYAGREDGTFGEVGARVVDVVR